MQIRMYVCINECEKSECRSVGTQKRRRNVMIRNSYLCSRENLLYYINF